ncbi:MAG: Uroporphyrinogen III synthase/methyltransferase [Parcubacteria group bacterium GW2011_GWA2_43_17]|nr:MAG: Uroporphyrinogen III synthase/methyltransferase [Parcubacteria group bacterium GW2011_GWA2_43_17]
MNIGKVYIVGAGPGSADLITIGGLRAIKKADVLICDNLLPRTFFEELGVFVGNKHIIWLQDENGHKEQSEINRLMADSAKQGKAVVRLKTGDPHIFGRGMEELAFLSENDISCEIIPGLTVATAAGALLDLPLTQRQRSYSFAVVTARCAGGKINESFPKADSLVIFMAVSILEKVANKLIKEGWPEDTPAVIAERVSMAWQNQVEGELENIASLAHQADIHSPAILIVGKAADKKELPQSRPRILFTGLDPANFRTMGTIIHWPAVKVVRIEEEYKKIPGIIEQLRANHFGYTIFTSRTSVQLFFEALKSLGLDSRVLFLTKIIACGHGTAMMLEENGIIADFIPAGMGSQAIVGITESQDKANVLLVQSATATEALAKSLAEKLGQIERLCLHCVQPHQELGRKLPEHDAIYFTCPSGVRAYWEKYGQQAFKKEVWCIGDVTAKQINEFNVKAKVVQPYVS